MSSGKTPSPPPDQEPEPDGERETGSAEHVEQGILGQANSDQGAEATTENQAETPRDWDAEWASITSDLGPTRPRFLLSDTPRIGAGQGARDYSPAEDPDEDRFIPVPPEPVGTSRVTTFAWAALIAGPVLMLLAVIAFDSAPAWYVATCLAIFLTGCVIGFTRLPGNRRDDGDGSAI